MLDETVMTGSILGFSLPNFWQGMMLIMIFSVWLGWLPSTGRGEVGTIFGIRTSLATWSGLSHLILPALNLALFNISLVIRLTRSGVRENDAARFREVRARQGALRAPHRVGARPQEHHDPDRHGGRRRVRQPHRVRDRDRDDLRLARAWASF